MPNTNADVLVIGAGPAGAIAGSLLARKGYKVRCVEKTFFPRFSIGESLLPRCNALLERAGLLGAVLERNYMPKLGAEFFRDEESVRFRFADGLPGTLPSTFQVPRADFDQTLATAARANGAQIDFGLEVTHVDFSTEGVVAKLADSEGPAQTVKARFLLDCSGDGRVLPRLLGIKKPAGLDPRVAYFTMVEGDHRPIEERAGDIWVCIHPLGPWIWIIPFSNGRTSVGVVGDPKVIDAAGGTDKTKLWSLLNSEPNAMRRLAGCTPVSPTMKLSNWASAVSKLHGERWAVAGNAGDFLDPVFSSGVCLALESSSLAAGLVDRTLKGENPDWQTQYSAVMQRAVAVFRMFVDGWYQGDLQKLFFSKNKPTRARQAVTSILAGYVLDEQNPMVTDPHGTLATLLKGIDMLAAHGERPSAASSS